MFRWGKIWEKRVARGEARGRIGNAVENWITSRFSQWSVCFCETLNVILNISFARARSAVTRTKLSWISKWASIDCLRFSLIDMRYYHWKNMKRNFERISNMCKRCDAVWREYRFSRETRELYMILPKIVTSVSINPPILCTRNDPRPIYDA